MHESGSGREARRRPELDLMLGPLEAASRSADALRDAGEPQLELIELAEPAVLHVPGEDG